MKNVCSNKIKHKIKQILSLDDKMQRLSSRVWEYEFKCWDIGKDIRKLDEYKFKLIDDDVLEKAKISCIYALPDYDKICDKIYIKFLPFWEKVQSHRQLIHKYRSTEIVEILAYLYYHYEGWIIRYGKETKGEEKK